MSSPDPFNVWRMSVYNCPLLYYHENGKYHTTIICMVSIHVQKRKVSVNIEKRIEKRFEDSDVVHNLTTLSIRTGFDLLLR